mgnify:CR=1 FL=1
MDNFFEITEKLSKDKELFKKQFLKIQEIKRQEEEEQKNKIKINEKEFYNNVPIIDNILIEIGENLDEEYIKKVTNNNPNTKNLTEDERWNSMVLGQIDKRKRQRQSRNEQELIIDKTKHPSDNVKKMYYHIIEKIQGLGLNIHHIEKDVKNFTNRNRTSFDGHKPVFILYCSKNNWNFKVEYEDDCECNPGILGVYDVFNKLTNEKIIDNYVCDIFCQNKHPDELENFLILLNCKDVDEYNKRRFKPFLDFKDILEKKYEVTFSGKILKNKSSIHPLTNSLMYTLKKDTHIVQLLFGLEWKEKDYGFYIKEFTTKTIKRYDFFEMDYNEIMEFKKENAGKVVGSNDNDNSLSKVSSQKEFIKLISKDDYPKVLNSIDNYFSMLDGNYGYFDGKRYWNDLEFCKYFGEKFNTTFRNNMYKVNGKSINSNTVLNNNDEFYWGKDSSINCDIESSVTNGQYLFININLRIEGYESYEGINNVPFQNYNINFTFNENTDKYNCYLVISGELDNIRNNKSEFIGRYDNKGSYSEMFELTTYFLDKMIKINGHNK